MNSSNSLIKGGLSAIILKLISEHGKMYGYEICQKVKEMTQGELKITEGALYPALHKLEGEGILVTYTEVVDGRSRKYYAIPEEQEGVAETRLNQIQGFIAQLQSILNPQLQPKLL